MLRCGGAMIAIPIRWQPEKKKLSLIKTLHDALLHHWQFRTQKRALRDLAKTMAAEKGLPKCVGQKDVEEFFGRL